MLSAAVKIGTITRRSQANEGGFSTLEILVSLAVGAIATAGMIVQLRSAVTASRDHQIRLETFVQSQAIVQTLAGELRMAGNGVPFDQANFQIGENSLSDPTVTEPILVASATSTNMSFRLNESGEVFLLTADFNPTASLTVSLTEIGKLEVNDPVYISNSVISGDDGFYSTIDSINTSSSTVTLNASYVSPGGATYGKGSILEEVPLVTFNSPSDGSGITRDSGYGTVLLGSNSVMSLEYLDHTGVALTLPLTTDNLINTFRSVRITVTLTSSKNLSSGSPHSVSIAQIVGIRNLNYFF